MKLALGSALLLICFSFGACSKHSSVSHSDTVDFAKQIAPLLTANCLPCHQSEALLGGLNLENRKTAFGGRKGGAFLIPGEPDSSLIYRVTEDPHGKDALGLEKMPMMKGGTLTPAEREVLRSWIEQGAHWPGGDEGWLKPLRIEGMES